jgi:translation initiation factor 3 subunit A
MIDAQLVEKARLAEEEKRIAAERMLQQRKAIERQEAHKLAEKIASELREKNVKIKDDEILDTEKLMELQVLQLEKERRELAQKSKALTKRFDHMERAYRKEEIPYLESDYAEQQKLEKQAYELKSKTTIEESKKTHADKIQIKHDLGRIVDDFKNFKSVLIKERDHHYAKLKKESAEKIEAATKVRIKEYEEKQAESLRRAKESKTAAQSKRFVSNHRS